MSAFLAERVAAYCRRHGLLPAGRPLLALVSGGADSTCLMHLLARIHDGPLGVLTLDHGLRPEAAAEVEAVRRAALGLGLAVHVERLGLEPGPAAQERAREARLAAALRLVEREGYERAATGHTASDQAETVLHRIARGSGRPGALGMAPRRGGLVRPLLCLSGEETRAWCAERGLAVVEDPGNRDSAYARARVRHRLLPALADVHPGAEGHVVAFAERLRDEGELLEGLVEAAWTRAARGSGLDAAALAEEPLALRRLLARRLLEEAGLPGEALAAEPLARVLALLEGGRRIDLPGGGGAAVERGRLVAFGTPSPPPPPVPLAVPGEVAFGDLALRALHGRGGPPAPGRVAVRAEGPFTVRPPAPGDRLALPGGGRRPVGRLLADAGVPARLRAAAPVVAIGERVVWVAGHRAAADLLAAPGEAAVVLELVSP